MGEKDRNLKLGELLLNHGIIDRSQLSEALEEQKKSKKKLGEVLIEKGFVAERQIIEVLARQYLLPVVNPLKIEIEENVLRIFSYELLKKYNIVPVKIQDDNLFIITNDPLNISAFRELGYISGCRIKPMMAVSKDIGILLNKYYGPMHSAQEAIKDIATDIDTSSAQQKEESVEAEAAAAEEAPVIKLVNSIVAEAMEQGVSDIHFEPQKENLRVRFRIDGILYEKVIIPKKLQPGVTSRIKIISGMDIAERRKPQDGRISLRKRDREFDVRVSTLPDIFGEKVVLRLLDKKNAIISLEKLGVDENELDMIEFLIHQPYGMILITGPTGSGKTTTLYSMLNILNDSSRSIVTVEDPVEYEMDGVNQTAINVRAGYTFATAIRHILRQDPDVIMIGEIRDLETAEIAIQAALTGHLVLSTLHTNSAPGAITRLLDMNVEPFLIASSVKGVIAQRLVRKLCPFCRKESVVSEEIKNKIAPLIPSSANELILAKPSGCEKCHGLGYKGRVGIFEILMVEEGIQELVLKRANEPEITELAVSRGMNTLKASGIKKALDKVTSMEEVMRVTFVERVYK
ncbi:MAG: hypothetical protein B1H08_00230 [Candidatus Omnitrophica bacterium 4484_171]|nr:MAG: hypothetical protein B1H08_00230 [Candidatus Omnitrophica bacterium 4484_171]